MQTGTLFGTMSASEPTADLARQALRVGWTDAEISAMSDEAALATYRAVQESFEATYYESRGSMRTAGA